MAAPLLKTPPAAVRGVAELVLLTDHYGVCAVIIPFPADP